MNDSILHKMEEISIPAEYEKRILAYVDVLGWSEKILNGPAEALQLAKVVMSFAMAKKTNEWGRKMRSDDDQTYTTEVTFCSDTFVRSCPADDPTSAYDLLQKTQSLINILLCNHGMLTRGAIVQGDLVHKDRAIFGPALLDAIAIEESECYPRVIVDPTLIKILHINGYRDIRRDDDGAYFVEFFIGHQDRPIDTDPIAPEKRLEKALAQVEKGWASASEHKIKIKWEWMRRYLNLHKLLQYDKKSVKLKV